MASRRIFSEKNLHCISEKPIVTLSCSSRIIVNEGDNFTCICRGEGGNPPADVTWYKDGVQISGIGKENKTLTLSNVEKTASGIYKCVTQSYTLTDEKSVEIIVHCKYKLIITFIEGTNFQKFREYTSNDRKL